MQVLLRSVQYLHFSEARNLTPKVGLSTIDLYTFSTTSMPTFDVTFPTGCAVRGKLKLRYSKHLQARSNY